ncbi:DUF7344 domain-containing protein [Halomarina oriensis]|uniref:DUF7344 domain-containing protein n=1 Tax=Halomarina oriensis TaxID=671145 RepID=A0A6B0GYE4_9EURY|nr:hypothetical protein [Halomarina oriensis]MWG36768.1 hypothetical protein [Halomarina oriensis]
MTHTSNAATSTARDPETLPLSVAYDLVRDSSRREVVRLLSAHPGPWTVSSLATELAATEAEADAAAVVDEDPHTRAAVRLYHCHLPRFADADVVTFDAETGTVAPGEFLPSLLPLV